MKHRVSLLIFILLASFSSSSIFAQRMNMQEALQKSSLDSQFFYIAALSRSQDADFKLIRKTNLEVLRKNALDTVKTLKTEIKTLKESSSSHASTTTELETKISTLEAELAQEKSKTDSISFMGIDFSKASYHTLVWSIIIVLALAFLITLASFRKAKVDTNTHKEVANEAQEELQTLRKKSMEREQQLKRQLLDEQMKRNS
ncbi:hypothetical protein [Sphingobacterium hungaricum]